MLLMVMNLKKKINNKVAIVTGGGSGIGKAVALGLAREGVDTYLAGRKKDKLLTTRQISVKENNEGICHAIKCDVSKETDVRKMFMLIQKHHGRLNLLFNNAGIGLQANTIDKIKFKDWKKVIDTNINGMFLCAKYAYKLMKKQRPKGGRIINNGSISAFTPRPGTAEGERGARPAHAAARVPHGVLPLPARTRRPSPGGGLQAHGGAVLRLLRAEHYRLPAAARG